MLKAVRKLPVYRVDDILEGTRPVSAMSPMGNPSTLDLQGEQDKRLEERNSKRKVHGIR